MGTLSEKACAKSKKKILVSGHVFMRHHITVAMSYIIIACHYSNLVCKNNCVLLGLYNTKCEVPNDPPSGRINSIKRKRSEKERKVMWYLAGRNQGWICGGRRYIGAAARPHPSTPLFDSWSTLILKLTAWH